MAEYIKVNTKIIDVYGPLLPSPVLQVYLGLLIHADSKGIITDRRTQAEWAKIVGVGGTTFKRSILMLQEYNLVDIIHPKNPNKCCAYVVIDPDKTKPPKKYTIKRMKEEMRT